MIPATLILILAIGGLGYSLYFAGHIIHDRNRGIKNKFTPAIVSSILTVFFVLWLITASHFSTFSSRTNWIRTVLEVYAGDKTYQVFVDHDRKLRTTEDCLGKLIDPKSQAVLITHINRVGLGLDLGEKLEYRVFELKPKR